MTNYYIVLFLLERVCLFEVVLSTTEWKGVFYPKCCIDTRFSKCSSQEFAGFTLYSMWEISFPLVSLVFIYLIYPSIYFKIVWPQVCFSLVDVIVTRKRELSKAKSLFRGTWKFSQKIFSQTNYLYINNSLQEICCSFFEALSINESFQLSYSRFNSAQSKNSHNNRAFLFPFSRKKSFTIFA